MKKSRIISVYLISYLESVKVQRFIFISGVGAAVGLAQIKGLPAVEAFFKLHFIKGTLYAIKEILSITYTSDF